MLENKLIVFFSFKKVLTKQKNLTLKYFVQENDEELPAHANETQYTAGGYSTPGIEDLHALQQYMTTE